MKDVLIVICTRANKIEEFESRPIYKSLMLHSEHPDVDFKVFANNKRGLSECYNEVLKDPANLDKTVLFVHDDVELEDLFLVDKLKNSPYSITGLAGAKSFNKRSDHLAWHLATHPEDYVGEAAHVQNGRVWTSVFGHTPSRALVIDGLFVSCKVKDLVEKELYFDEEFAFHFYDIAFCLRAAEKKVTCGVLPIRVVHHGLGDSMKSKDWVDSAAKFKEAYCK